MGPASLLTAVAFVGGSIPADPESDPFTYGGPHRRRNDRGQDKHHDKELSAV